MTCSLARGGRGCCAPVPAPHTPERECHNSPRGVRGFSFPFFLLFFPLSLFPSFPFLFLLLFSLSLDVDKHIDDGYFPDKEVMQIIPTATPSTALELVIHQQWSTNRRNITGVEVSLWSSTELEYLAHILLLLYCCPRYLRWLVLGPIICKFCIHTYIHTYIHAINSGPCI